MNQPLAKIESREAVVSVIGLGYVGLPLATALEAAGFRTIGIDTSQERVDAINSGVFAKEHAGGFVRADGDGRSPGVATEAMTRRLSATTDYASLESADVAIICVPTPLSKTGDPDLSFVIAAAEGIAERLHTGMLVILESTGYPGMTEEVLLSRLQNAGGTSWKVGQDFFLAFSPERIDPGRADWTVRNTPKVVGGVTPSCLQMVEALYSRVIDSVVPVSSPKVAEMTKLLENTFRATNIALVNEIAMMCDRLGVDVWEAIEAAKTKPFGFMPFYPGPGLGGHCIPVDPQYLAWKLKTLNYNARFIQLAAEINMGMPAHVVGRVADALNEARKPMNGSRVLLLGVAYKPNVGDIRESPALDLIELLQGKGVEVAYHDPYVERVELPGGVVESVVLDEAVIGSADCVVITTDHATYDWQWVVDNSSLIIDTRNATGSIKTDKRWTAKA